MSSVRPLSPLDFLSEAQTLQYIKNRQADAVSRQAAFSPEGAGLVPVRTSRTHPAFQPSVLVHRTSCETGIARRHEILVPGHLVTNHLPANPEAIEIDQAAMRLKRLKKNVLNSSKYHEKETGGRCHALMVTLTYRPNVDWDPKQISRYLDAVKKWYKRRKVPCRYVWVFELTKKGRPHYHVLFWHPKGRFASMPKADRRGWWPHGMTQTQKARNAVGYLAKYASKGTDDILPKGVRLYGIGGLTLASRLVRAWWNLPTGVRRWGTPFCRWRRALGGGWVCRSTGEWRQSLWVVQLVMGRVFAFPRAQAIPSPLDELLLGLKHVLLRNTF